MSRAGPPDASGVVRAHGGGMPGLRVVVSPPSPTGGRRVRVDGTILGLAHGLQDVAEFLRRAGLDGVEVSDVEHSELIDWRGGGPSDWGAQR